MTPSSFDGEMQPFTINEVSAVLGGENDLVINNYGMYDPNGQFKYSLLFLCYFKKTKRIKTIPIPKSIEKNKSASQIKCDESIL